MINKIDRANYDLYLKFLKNIKVREFFMGD